MKKVSFRLFVAMLFAVLFLASCDVSTSGSRRTAGTRQSAKSAVQPTENPMPESMKQ